MLRSVCCTSAVALVARRQAQAGSAAALFEVPRRFRQRRILTWPVDYLPFTWTYPTKKDNILNSGDRKDNIEIQKADTSRPRPPSPN